MWGGIVLLFKASAVPTRQLHTATSGSPGRKLQLLYSVPGLGAGGMIEAELQGAARTDL